MPAIQKSAEYGLYVALLFFLALATFATSECINGLLISFDQFKKLLQRLRSSLSCAQQLILQWDAGRLLLTKFSTHYGQFIAYYSENVHSSNFFAFLQNEFHPYLVLTIENFAIMIHQEYYSLSQREPYQLISRSLGSMASSAQQLVVLMVDEFYSLPQSESYKLVTKSLGSMASSVQQLIMLMVDEFHALSQRESCQMISRSLGSMASTPDFIRLGETIAGCITDDLENVLLVVVAVTDALAILIMVIYLLQVAINFLFVSSVIGRTVASSEQPSDVVCPILSWEAVSGVDVHGSSEDVGTESTVNDQSRQSTVQFCLPTASWQSQCSFDSQGGTQYVSPETVSADCICTDESCADFSEEKAAQDTLPVDVADPAEADDVTNRSLALCDNVDAVDTEQEMPPADTSCFVACQHSTSDSTKSTPAKYCDQSWSPNNNEPAQHIYQSPLAQQAGPTCSPVVDPLHHTSPTFACTYTTGVCVPAGGGPETVLVQFEDVYTAEDCYDGENCALAVHAALFPPSPSSKVSSSVPLNCASSPQSEPSPTCVAGTLEGFGEKMTSCQSDDVAVETVDEVQEAWGAYAYTGDVNGYDDETGEYQEDNYAIDEDVDYGGSSSDDHESIAQMMERIGELYKEITEMTPSPCTRSSNNGESVEHIDHLNGDDERKCSDNVHPSTSSARPGQRGVCFTSPIAKPVANITRATNGVGLVRSSPLQPASRRRMASSETSDQNMREIASPSTPMMPSTSTSFTPSTPSSTGIVTTGTMSKKTSPQQHLCTPPPSTTTSSNSRSMLKNNSNFARALEALDAEHETILRTEEKQRLHRERTRAEAHILPLSSPTSAGTKAMSSAGTTTQFSGRLPLTPLSSYYNNSNPVVVPRNGSSGGTAKIIGQNSPSSKPVERPQRYSPSRPPLTPSELSYYETVFPTWKKNRANAQARPVVHNENRESH